MIRTVLLDDRELMLGALRATVGALPTARFTLFDIAEPVEANRIGSTE